MANGKSLVRHILTALATILVLLGVDSLTPVVSFLQTSLDQVWDAAIVIVGFGTSILAFFNDKGGKLDVLNNGSLGTNT